MSLLPIRIVMADDHEVTLLGFADLLSQVPDMELVATASDGAGAVKMALDHKPDVVLMDLRMPGLNGTQAVERILDEWPQARVVVLTNYDLLIDVRDALAAGAMAYLLKDSDPNVLLGVIREVHAGMKHYGPSVLNRLAEGMSRPQALQLTRRELDVLECIAAGLGNLEIAAKLTLQESTVKSHCTSLFGKMGVQDRLGAIREGIHLGYLRLGTLPP